MAQSVRNTQFHPNYFHPSKRNNKPVIERRHFKGKGWEALLTFGYAPTKEEYNDLGIIPPKRYEPYYVSLSKQGLDIIKDDRIVNFTQLAEIGLIYKPHNNFNNIRGEIDLIKGFPTSTSKNFVMRHEHWVEMIIKIKDFLDSKDYLKQKVVPGEIPEFIYRERLAEYLKDNPFKTYDDVKTEVAVGELNGKIDVLSDGIAWEIKKSDAKGLDVWQLFAYVEMGDYPQGNLVAHSFGSGAESAVQFIKQNYNKEIQLITLDSLRIDGPLTEKERKLV